MGEINEDIEAESDSIILDLKAIIEIRTGASKFSQKWIYQGRILSDEITVGKAGIIEGNVVHVVKTAMRESSDLGTPTSSKPVLSPSASSPSNNITSSVSIDYSRNVATFDAAMKTLLLNSETDAKNAVTTLSKILKNIIESPLEEKYRSLKGSNAALQKKLLSVRGGPDCLRALGFISNGSDWTLAPSPEAWEVLLLCRDKLDRFVSMLSGLDNIPISAPVPLPSPPAETVPIFPPAIPTTADGDADPSSAVRELIQAFVAMQTQPPP